MANPSIRRPIFERFLFKMLGEFEMDRVQKITKIRSSLSQISIDHAFSIEIVYTYSDPI